MHSTVMLCACGRAKSRKGWLRPRVNWEKLAAYLKHNNITISIVKCACPDCALPALPVRRISAVL